MDKTNNYAECTKTLNKSFVDVMENESFPEILLYLAVIH